MKDKIFITNRECFKNLFDDPEKVKSALEEAIKARKEETELYWKRATYFWTLSAIAFTGFFTFTKSTDQQAEIMLVIVCCIGFFFSSTWLLANRGAMQWLLNWHLHVFLLEDQVLGPLFKTIEDDSEATYYWPFSGKSYSVVKLNQSLCFYLTTLWFFLLIYSLVKSCESCGCVLKHLEDYMHYALAVMTVGWCLLNWHYGESDKKSNKKFKMKLINLDAPSEEKGKTK
ncbi:hypothetical protein [Gimesia maris]|uniref:RipA family octameric membrane protein n=1 Tax=Gimesia maris TaxID=122 RepID=UPI0032EAE28F